MNPLEEQLQLLKRFEVEFVIIGGVAATAHGSSYITDDLDICYSRTPANLERLAQAMVSVHASLRGAPKNLPFVCDVDTLKQGLNFTLDTDIGPIDLLGEVSGVGTFADTVQNAVTFELFGSQFRTISLPKLIAAKRAAGRMKDLLVLPELEAIQEFKEKASGDSSE